MLPGWSTMGLSPITSTMYVTIANPAVDGEYMHIYKQAFETWFHQDRVEAAEKRGFRLGFHWRQPPLNGAQTCPDNLPQSIMARKLKPGNDTWTDIMFTQVDYCLGGNEMNACFVTGTGHRWIKYLRNWYTMAGGNPITPTGMIGNGVFPHKKLASSNLAGVHDQQNFSAYLLYPDHTKWGFFEMFFENWMCDQTNSVIFTNNAMAAVSYAMLRDGGPGGVNTGVQPRTTTAQQNPAAGIGCSLTHTPEGMTITVGRDAAAKSIRLMDLQGRCHYRAEMTGAMAMIPAGAVATGTYLLQVVGDKAHSRQSVLLVR